jgi:hypothetical protein
MSIKLMTWVWDNSKYEGARLLLHLSMADHANDEGWFYAGQKRLASRARCSIDYVRLTCNQMIEDGYLLIDRKGNGRGMATQYVLLKPNSVGGLITEKMAKAPTLPAETPNSACYQPLRTFNIKDNGDKSPEPVKELSTMKRLVALYFDNLENAPIKPTGKMIAGQIQLALRDTTVDYLEILIPMVAKAGLPLTPNTLMITAREQSKTVADIQRAARSKEAAKQQAEALDRQMEEARRNAVPMPETFKNLFKSVEQDA